MQLKTRIDHTSRLYRAYHEAGHCLTAYAVGAHVEFVELFPAAGGVCRVTRAPDPNVGKLIAAGGFAVEFLLYTAGRTTDVAGAAITEKAFIDIGLNNASDDKQNFFGANHMDAEGFWPKEMDEEFIGKARVVASQLESAMLVIDAIAQALEASSKLSRDQVESILNKFGVDIGSN